MSLTQSFSLPEKVTMFFKKARLELTDASRYDQYFTNQAELLELLMRECEQDDLLPYDETVDAVKLTLAQFREYKSQLQGQVKSPYEEEDL